MIRADERRYIQRLLCGVRRSKGAVVLVGSTARGVSVEAASDIDLLLVGDIEVPAGRVPPRIQLLRMNEGEFDKRFAGGDDFTQWALRFGIPLTGRSYWKAFREAHAPEGLPRFEPKVELAKKAARYAHELLELEDVESAQEETRLALSHIARALLLARGIFPLSRPELALQLREAGATELAIGLDDLATRRVDANRLRELLLLLDLTAASVQVRSHAPSMRKAESA